MESLKDICSRIKLQKEVEEAVLAIEEKKSFPGQIRKSGN